MPQIEPGWVVFGKRDGEHLSMRLTEHTPDGWLRGVAEISAGPWSGEIPIEFFLNELSRFAAEIDKLYENLIGPARLDPLDPYLTLEMKGDGRRHIFVHGKAPANSAMETYLTFCLELEQTQLPMIAKSLRAADAS